MGAVRTVFDPDVAPDIFCRTFIVKLEFCIRRKEAKKSGVWNSKQCLANSKQVTGCVVTHATLFLGLRMYECLSAQLGSGL